MKLEAPTNTIFPLINACLNGLAGLLLLIGFIFVKRRDFVMHKKVMWAAFAVSSLFLASYLYYHFNYRSGKFSGTGWIRPAYFAMLISHILLAVGILPFILRMLYLAQSGRFLEHRRIARVIWPLWMYTSITGVLVYLMLYQFYPAPILP